MSVSIGKRMTNAMELTNPLQDVCWALLIDWGSNHIPVMMRLISSNLSMLISFTCLRIAVVGSLTALTLWMFRDRFLWCHWHAKSLVPGCHFSTSTFGSRHSSWFQHQSYGSVETSKSTRMERSLAAVLGTSHLESPGKSPKLTDFENLKITSRVLESQVLN